MASALISLGGNVGDVRGTFKKAIANICGMTQAALLARSSDYTTPPWGDEQQLPFVNACIEIDTRLDPNLGRTGEMSLERGSAVQKPRKRRGMLSDLHER